MALTAFHDVPFPLAPREGIRLRFQFATDVIRCRGGGEQRRYREYDGHWECDLAPLITSQGDLHTLHAFWRARQGRRYSFRFANPLDQVASNVILGIGDGTTAQYQLLQAYSTGVSGDGYTARRIVTLPVAGSVSVTQAAGLREHWSMDYATGALTWGQLAHTVTLERVTGIDRIVSDGAFDWVAFGVQVGDLTRLANTASHDGIYTVAGFADSNTTITVTGADFSAGEASVVADVFFPPAVGVATAWSGIYDIPMRFTATRMPVRLQDLTSDFQAALTLIEDRGYATITPGVAEDALPTTVVAALPEYYSAGAEIGPYHTIDEQPSDTADVLRIPTGSTQLVGQIPYANRTPAETQALLAWFLCRKGRYVSFSVHDPSDDTALAVETLGIGDGETSTFDLLKSYDSGGEAIARRIRRPEAGSVTVYLDSVEQTSGVTINEATGQATFATAPALGEVVTATVAAFNTLMRFDTDTIEITLSHAVSAYDIAALDLIEVTEEPPIITYLGGTTGLPVAPPSGCAVVAYAPPAAPPRYVAFRSDALKLGSAQDDQRVIHRSLKGYSAMTVSLVCENFTEGVYVEIPSGEAVSSETYWGDETWRKTHFLNFRLFLRTNTPGLLMGVTTRSGCGGMGINVQNDPCDPGTRGIFYTAPTSADAESVLQGRDLSNLGPVVGGIVSELMVLVVTVSLFDQTMYVSGTMHGTARARGNPSALGVYAYSSIQTDPNTGCWGVYPALAKAWVADINLTQLRFPIVGGIPGQLTENLLNDAGNFDLHELMIERHLPPLQTASAAIAMHHQTLLRYFYRRYMLGQAPAYAPLNPLGWWTVDQLSDVGTGGLVTEWASNGSGLLLTEFLPGAGINKTPIIQARASAPRLAQDARLITYTGAEPVTTSTLVSV